MTSNNDKTLNSLHNREKTPENISNLLKDV